MIIKPEMYQSVESALLWYATSSKEDITKYAQSVARLAIACHGSKAAIGKLYPGVSISAEPTILRAEACQRIVVGSGHSREPGAEGPGAVAD